MSASLYCTIYIALGQPLLYICFEGNFACFSAPNMCDQCLMIWMVGQIHGKVKEFKRNFSFSSSTQIKSESLT